MSDTSDKTEKPTQKKIQDAREQGQTVKSQDFNSGMLLTVGTALLIWYGGFWVTGIKSAFQSEFNQMATVHLWDQKHFINALHQWLNTIATLVLPFVVTMMVVAICCSLATAGLNWTTKPLIPNITRLNPMPKIKQLFDKNKFVELVKSLVKLVIVGSVIWNVSHGNIERFLTWMPLPAMAGWIQGVLPVLQQLMWNATISLLLIGVFDWRYQAYKHMKQLMMSRQDIMDERKNSDGDGKMKSRMKRMGRAMIEKKQLLTVPKADVIINNPTHFSVAIQYDPDLGPAPRVIAKGQDHFAFKIREIAKANNVPMVENKPLAQSLYKTVEVDQMIPPELFVAVAEVLAYVYTRNKSRRPVKT